MIKQLTDQNRALEFGLKYLTSKNNELITKLNHIEKELIKQESDTKFFAEKYIEKSDECRELKKKIDELDYLYEVAKSEYGKLVQNG